jgi:hypothetical protein
VLTCLSPNGGDLTASNAPALKLLVGTVRGVFALERHSPGAPWAVAYASMGEKHISSLLYEPGSGLLFAGSHGNGGLWLSRDEGRLGVPDERAGQAPCLYHRASNSL